VEVNNICVVEKKSLNKSVKESELGEEERKDKDLEEKLEKKKRSKIEKILATEYIIKFLKSIRVVLYILAILVALLAVIQKCNAWGALTFIASIIASFRGCKFSNLKWYNLVIMLILILEYLTALSNLSKLNSPSVIPIPFDQRGITPPIDVPFYQKYGDVFVETNEIGESKS
jgi:uncharacterized protein YqhQ